jgi:hypothetical protein
MKIKLFIFPALLSSLLFSCGEKKDSQYENSVKAQNEMSGPEHETDTNMVKRDGTILEGTLDASDSVKLPDRILEMIENDNSLSHDKIISKRKFTENSITYYEIEFRISDTKTEMMTFDEDGKMRPEN